MARATTKSRYDDDFEEGDEEEFETPAKSSSKKSAPISAKKRREVEEDEEDDEEEAPVRKKGAVSSKRSRVDEDEEEDEEEDDAPRAKPKFKGAKGKEAPTTKRVLKRGWKEADKVQEDSAEYSQRLKVTEDQQLIKFLEDEPYASYRVHWLESREGQKSFVCISDDKRGCPLCGVSPRASAKFSFNVALLEAGEEPLIRSYDVGVRVYDQLKNYHSDPRQGPLSKHYWAVSKTGKKTNTQYLNQMVRSRDLEEEWGVTPLDADSIEQLQASMYDSDIIQVPTYNEMLEIATELLDAR